MSIHQFPDRWRYPLGDMADARNRRAWEKLLDFGLRSSPSAPESRDDARDDRDGRAA